MRWTRSRTAKAASLGRCSARSQGPADQANRTQQHQHQRGHLPPSGHAWLTRLTADQDVDRPARITPGDDVHGRRLGHRPTLIQHEALHSEDGGCTAQCSTSTP